MNGIIINDEPHELVSLRTSPPCDNCSLQENCDKTDFFLCTVIVLQHFSGYIASLSMRKLYDERGNVYFGVDEEIRERLQAKLMRAILTFRAE